MDEEHSDEFEEEECLHPSMALDGCEDDNNEIVRNTRKERSSEFDPDKHMEPVVGMEFESYVAAGKFYDSYARTMGFEMKIRQSRSNSLGKWYVQFSCNREGFRRARPTRVARKRTDRSDRPDVRCGCLATMKVKLIGHNRWKVIKVNLVHNHLIEGSKAPHRRSHHIENSAMDGRDECMDPSTSIEEAMEEDPDDMEEEISETNITEMEKTSGCDQSAYVEPTLGMEFESYVAAGEFYDAYAEHVGFETKIRQSRSNLKHGKRYVQFSCNKEGFKRSKDPRAASTRRDRPDIRCGCQATMKIKLTGQNRWRVFYVNLTHNHEIGPRIRQKQRPHKKLHDSFTRRSRHRTVDPEAGNPSPPSLIEAEPREQLQYHEMDPVRFHERSIHLELGEGDIEAMRTFFDRMQLRNSSFFYSLDPNDDGKVRNAFWVDSRSRAAYEYFGDVVTFDTTCLTTNYNIKLVLFVGVNHHGQPVLLGCGLLSSESKESFTWLFRTWLMAMSDHSPYAIISDQLEAIQGAVAEVFPHSHYRFCLRQIMKKVTAEFSSLAQFDELKRALRTVIYDSLRVYEFERGWNDMLTRYALQNNHWLKSLYKSREKWVPCFLKCGFWAGMCNSQSDWAGSLFDGYLHPTTCLREFLEQYEPALNAKYAEEAFTDFTNFKPQQSLDKAHWFEAQLVNVYTTDIFKKFQQEVNGMVRCYDMSPIHVDDSITSFLLKERILGDDGKLLPKEYEVFYNKAEAEVTCVCNLFQFKGFLCRHSLYILQNHGIVEIPSRYIIARWRKDYKHNRSLWYNSTNLMPNASTQWHDVLYQKCRRIVEESALSERGYLVALQVLDEGLQKVHTENDAAMKANVGEANSCPERDVTRENGGCGNSTSAFFYTNLQGRADEPNDRLMFDLERTATSQKSNAYLAPVICESCLAGETFVNPATNLWKKRRISVGSGNPSSEMPANQTTTHDLLGFSATQHGMVPLVGAPYFCAPPTFPGYVPLRYPPASMMDSGFQMDLQTQQGHEQ